MIDPDELPDLEDAPVVEPEPEPKSHDDRDQSDELPEEGEGDDA